MTREQALQKLKDVGGIGVSADRGCLYHNEFVDACVALGMLKLDAPLTRDQKIATALKSSLGVFASSDDLERVKNQLAIVGLTIVEG